MGSGREGSGGCGCGCGGALCGRACADGGGGGAGRGGGGAVGCDACQKYPPAGGMVPPMVLVVVKICGAAGL